MTCDALLLHSQSEPESDYPLSCAAFSVKNAVTRGRDYSSNSIISAKTVVAAIKVFLIQKCFNQIAGLSFIQQYRIVEVKDSKKTGRQNSLPLNYIQAEILETLRFEQFTAI